MPHSVSRTIAGFLAGFLAVVIFHQVMYVILQQMGVPLQGSPWNMNPNKAAYGLPTIINQAFWGGLWGILFAFMIDNMPGGPAWLKGFIFGVIFPMLLGSWLIVALVKGQPMFADFLKDYNILRLRNGFLLNGVAFGIGLGILYPLLARFMPGASHARH